MNNIAIIGSRHYPRPDLVVSLLVGLLPPGRHILTGDASGVDHTVREWVSRLTLNPLAGHTLSVYPANWPLYGKAAGAMRNHSIIANAQVLIAFWDLFSPGTRMMLNLAAAADLPTYIYGPAGQLLPEQLSLFGSNRPDSLPDMSTYPTPEELSCCPPKNDSLAASFVKPRRRKPSYSASSK